MELSGRLGRIGNAARAAGRHELAIALLQHSLSFADTERARTVATIRLGDAYRAAGRLDESERTLRDFARQHLGKCLTDAGRSGEARACLIEALELRRAKGDRDLIASTGAALADAGFPEPTP